MKHETNDLELFARIADEQSAGRPLVLATVIGKSGSVPRGVGARMLIWGDGTALGSVGGGCVESEIRSAAREVLLVTRQPRTVTVRLIERGEGGTGDVCGGRMEVFLDYISPEAVYARD